LFNLHTLRYLLICSNASCQEEKSPSFTRHAHITVVDLSPGKRRLEQHFQTKAKKLKGSHTFLFHAHFQRISTNQSLDMTCMQNEYTGKALTNAQAHHRLYEPQPQSSLRVRVLPGAAECHPKSVLRDSVWCFPCKTQGTSGAVNLLEAFSHTSFNKF
jgi:hypothetical protein